MDNGGRKLRKYLSNSNPRDLIREVKCRPGLYDKDKLEQPRKEHKQQLWLEVAESLTAPEVWESYKEDDKEAKVDEVQHKWKHLRNHFLREVKLVRAGKQHTKRKYIYYHDMEFMTPYVGIKPGRPRVKYNDSDDSDNSSSSPKELTKEQKLVINKFDGLKKISEKVRPLNPTSSTTITQVKNPIPSISMRDGDISFCLSLVPTMRKLEESKKLKAKIDILTILHKYVDADPPVKRAKVASNHSRTNHSNEREEHLFELEYASNIKQDATNDTDKNAENVWWT